MLADWWRPVPEFPDYIVNHRGEVRRIGAVKPIGVNRAGYVHLWRDGRERFRKVTCLVEQAFNDLPQVSGAVYWQWKNGRGTGGVIIRAQRRAGADELRREPIHRLPGGPSGGVQGGNVRRLVVGQGR